MRKREVALGEAVELGLLDGFRHLWHVGTLS